ncbi:MAG: hypothetical protein P1V97_08585 [Planctomycetota bacterium]|nr:hypothetical protein [Planctomycetota bacterium]
MQGSNDGDLPADDAMIRSRQEEDPHNSNPKDTSRDQREYDIRYGDFEEGEVSRYQALYKALKKTLGPENFDLD